MTEREALKLALVALENTTPTGFNMERDKQFFAAITAIREALAQRTWVGLTDEEIVFLWRKATMKSGLTLFMVRGFAQAIEAKLKEKNT